MLEKAEKRSHRVVWGVEFFASPVGAETTEWNVHSNSRLGFPGHLILACLGVKLFQIMGPFYGKKDLPINRRRNEVNQLWISPLVPPGTSRYFLHFINHLDHGRNILFPSFLPPPSQGKNLQKWFFTTNSISAAFISRFQPVTIHTQVQKGNTKRNIDYRAQWALELKFKSSFFHS